MSVEVSLPAAHELGTLLEPEYHKPGGVRVHKNASEKLRKENNVKTKGAAKATVNIFDTSASYKLITTMHTRIRAVIVLYCFIWSKGVWFLPNANYTKCMDELDPLLVETEKVHRKFLSEYENLKSLWQDNGGKLATGHPFPTRDELKAKLWVSIKPGLPVDPTDIRCGALNEKERDRFKADVAKSESRKLRGTVTQLQDKVRERADKIIEHMKNEKGTEKDSMLDQVRFLAGQLADMNLTNDPAVEEVRQKLEKDICSLDSESLRNSPELRKRTGRTMEDIRNRLGAFGTARN